MAEPQAEEDLREVDVELVDHDQLGSVPCPRIIGGFSEWVVGPASTLSVTAPSAGKLVRWLAEEAMSDLYEQFRASCVEDGAVAAS